MSNLEEKGPLVVFVCEHGSAKSVVAATHFNGLAAESGLGLRAISRGTNPDEELAPNAVRGLKADGLAVPEEKPKRLSSLDLARAARVITFCQLPKGYGDAPRVERWDGVPPVSEDYDISRKTIVELIDRLIGELAAARSSLSGR